MWDFFIVECKVTLDTGDTFTIWIQLTSLSLALYSSIASPPRLANQVLLGSLQAGLEFAVHPKILTASVPLNVDAPFNCNQLPPVISSVATLQ